MKRLSCLIAISLLLLPAIAQAQSVKAQVLQVLDSSQETVPDTGTLQAVQDISVKILEGTDKGRVVTIHNDFVQLKEGDVFYLDDAQGQFSVSEAYRLPQLGWLLVLFIILVIIFGGKQGIRGLLSLGGSLVFVMFVLIPGILHGYSPVWLSVGVASLIIVVGSYVTHGFNRTTSAAVVGMIVTVGIVGLFAHFAIGYTQLSGFNTEEATFLNLGTQGTLDFAGILLGGILIGLLGVMYDAAIGQAISVEELHHIAPHINRRTIYVRALRIGREHIGALVNTLAIAYVGASLPLLLLFYSSSGESASVIINSEIFATEIVRSLIGSIGLVLAVPITTAIAIFVIMRKKGEHTTDSASPEELHNERHALEHASHGHHH
ncbi:MAG: YibE/F family protein [Patescibacteria group bacterium]|nr:YibE/F family protein [Patescibacteria group bacterium]